MSNLVLTRKAGQSVRLMLGGEARYLEILRVTGGDVSLRLMSLNAPLRMERIRFRGEMQIAEGVTVTVIDLAKGHAKLGFDAPRDVHILRTELIKEKEDV